MQVKKILRLFGKKKPVLCSDQLEHLNQSISSSRTMKGITVKFIYYF